MKKYRLNINHGFSLYVSIKNVFCVVLGSFTESKDSIDFWWHHSERLNVKLIILELICLILKLWYKSLRVRISPQCPFLNSELLCMDHHCALCFYIRVPKMAFGHNFARSLVLYLLLIDLACIHLCALSLCCNDCRFGRAGCTLPGSIGFQYVVFRQLLMSSWLEL